MRIPDFAYAKTKAQVSFVFATWIVQFLIYLFPKFQDSSFLLREYRQVCVRPGQKYRRLFFSCCSPFDCTLYLYIEIQANVLPHKKMSKVYKKTYVDVKKKSK